VEQQRQTAAAALNSDAIDAFCAGDFECAIRLLSRAIRLDPSNAPFYANRSLAALSAAKNRMALEDAEAAIRCDAGCAIYISFMYGLRVNPMEWHWKTLRLRFGVMQGALYILALCMLTYMCILTAAKLVMALEDAEAAVLSDAGCAIYI